MLFLRHKEVENKDHHCKVCFYHGFYIRWLFVSRCARMMKTRSFSEKKIGFDDSFDVTKCLQHIEMSDLLHECA